MKNPFGPFAHTPRQDIPGVIVYARSEGGLLLRKVGRHFDLPRGLKEPGEDDNSAAIRIMGELTTMTFDPQPANMSLTDMNERPLVRHSVVEATNLQGDIDPNEAKGLGFYSEHRLPIILAAAGATAILGAFLAVRGKQQPRE